ncbi:hypothetical protein CWE06_02900 [Aliidiomarina haloalkalitolerans]|uniref:Bifunctional diguanylate cyclase/phosphodiesterase n=2 Tax=Aliidiomarina haloalkalitolerans TaxID=859059 RepID=A0A432VYS9_9GAMM|nr:hypothetical protein CWE06_02900 [Aliidiomarina haloalkalitolerans]
MVQKKKHEVPPMLKRHTNETLARAFFVIAALSVIFIGGIAILYILSGTTTSIYPRFLAFSGIACMLLGATLLATLTKRAAVKIPFAVTCLVYASYIVYILATQIPDNTPLSFYSSPIIVTSILFAIGIHSILPATHWLALILWRAIATMVTGGCLVLVIMIWVPEINQYLAPNPTALAAIAVILLMAGIAMFTFDHRKQKGILVQLRSYLMASIAIVLTMLVWLTLSTRDANEMVARAEAIISEANRYLGAEVFQYDNTLRQISQRWSLKETIPSSSTDLAIEQYMQAHPHVFHMRLVNQAGERLSDVKNQDLEFSEREEAWLLETFGTESYALSIDSIVAGHPILILTKPVVSSQGEALQLTAAINFSQFVRHDVPEYLSFMRVFVELADQVIISINDPAFEHYTAKTLRDQYPFVFSRSLMLTPDFQAQYHATIFNYELIWDNARLNQLVLIFGCLFSILLLFAFDTNRKLRQQQVKLQEIASFDTVTGLLRRDMLEFEVNQAIQSNQAGNAHILFIDLDGFKPINDSLGIEMGNTLLRQVAERIKSCVPRQALVSRFSSDEFIVYLPQLAEKEAMTVANSILKRIGEHFVVDDLEVHLTASIGVAPVVLTTNTATQHIQHADVAMSAAKARGGNTVSVFSLAMAAESEKHYQMRSRIKAALERKEFDVFFQGIVATKTYATIGYEALARWPQENGGFTSPAEFIPVAEQTGQIVEISHFVLDRSISFLAKLNQTQPDCYVAVNLSVQLFERIDMFKTLHSLLEIHHANPRNLHVELTESVFIEDFDLVSNTLRQLRELGIQVSLDDFGTGFSSLSMLHKLPIDIVKVDRSFVLELGRNSESRKIAESVMLLAKTLNKKVIVEGIENQEQIEFSESFECDGLQGFYFHKPLPAAAILPNNR